MTVGMSVADAGEFRVIDDYTNDGSNAEKDTQHPQAVDQPGDSVGGF